MCRAACAKVGGEEVTDELEMREEREEWRDEDRASRPLSEATEGEVGPVEEGTTVAPRFGPLPVVPELPDSTLAVDVGWFPAKGMEEGGKRVSAAKGELLARDLCPC